MDPKFLHLYNNELRHLRSTALEFAREQPQIAGQLGMDNPEEVEDPYVERLLEGCAFLTARIQRKMDAEFPRITQGIFETVYPEYLAPTPSMAIVQFQPDLKDPSLAEGVPVPRGTRIRSKRPPGHDGTPCTFTTAHDLKLWPLELVAVSYHDSRELSQFELAGDATVARSALRLKLRSTVPLPFAAMAMDEFSFYLRGTRDNVPVALYEHIVARGCGVSIQWLADHRRQQGYLPASHVREHGFEENEALLPPSPRGFEGYRYLREYFALPERYLFISVRGMQRILKQVNQQEIEILMLFKTAEDPRLSVGALDRSAVELFATPAINLFAPHRTDRVELRRGAAEHLVIPDTSRPIDFEVFSVDRVIGHGAHRQEFYPFYLARDEEALQRSYFTIFREERPKTVDEREGRRQTPSYLGSNVYVSIVDASCSPYHTDIRELDVKVRCTNRHLPLSMAKEFEVELSPLQSIRCLTGPTRPLPSYAQGDIYWRLVSHLSLNYMSILDRGDGSGAAALRELLSLYIPESQKAADKKGLLRQIDGILSVQSKPVVKALIDGPGRMSFARGVEVNVDFKENAFEGFGIFILGAVLERFFAKQVTLNGFAQTVISSDVSGDIHRWPVRIGKQVLL